MQSVVQGIFQIGVNTAVKSAIDVAVAHCVRVNNLQAFAQRALIFNAGCELFVSTPSEIGLTEHWFRSFHPQIALLSKALFPAILVYVQYKDENLLTKVENQDRKAKGQTDLATELSGGQIALAAAVSSVAKVIYDHPGLAWSAIARLAGKLSDLPMPPLGGF